MHSVTTALFHHNHRKQLSKDADNSLHSSASTITPQPTPKKGFTLPPLPKSLHHPLPRKSPTQDSHHHSLSPASSISSAVSAIQDAERIIAILHTPGADPAMLLNPPTDDNNSFGSNKTLASVGTEGSSYSTEPSTIEGDSAMMEIDSISSPVKMQASPIIMGQYLPPPHSPKAYQHPHSHHDTHHTLPHPPPFTSHTTIDPIIDHPECDELYALQKHRSVTDPPLHPPYSSMNPVAPCKVSGTLSLKLLEIEGLSMSEVPEEVRAVLEKWEGVGTGAGEVGDGGKWWYPYVVVGWDGGEVVVDAYGGEFLSPIYCYTTVFDVSRPSSLTLSAYIRAHPPGEGGSPPREGSAHTLFHTDRPQPSRSSSHSFAHGLEEMTFDERNKSTHIGSHDPLLCTLTYTPMLTGGDVAMETRWFGSEKGTGRWHIGVGFKSRVGGEHHLGSKDFELLKVLGKGSYGKVFQVRKKDTGKIYAMKVLKKSHIAAKHEVLHTLSERTILAQVDNPFIVHLKYSFQTTEKLYLVMPYVNGGELFHHLRQAVIFNEPRAAFYAAELIIALEHLHMLGVVYRDLKPENILLTYEGHVMLCDFGLCKLDMYDEEKTNTFCGTPDYVAPEVLIGRGYTNTVDWWTLGILLYEMLSGFTPFYHPNKQTMYNRILSAPLKFPTSMSKEARMVCFGLLTRDPRSRLGAFGANEIKRCEFFAGRGWDWAKIAARKVKPPWKPNVSCPSDVSNIDEEFLKQRPVDSVVEDSGLSETFQRQFEGFTYQDKSAI